MCSSHLVGFAYIPLNGTGPGQNAFVFLYCLTNFFLNFGPNTTTFIVPAEAFPTRYRSTAHGLSAACGKSGAIIAQLVFGPLLLHNRKGFQIMYVSPLAMFCVPLSDTVLPRTQLGAAFLYHVDRCPVDAAHPGDKARIARRSIQRVPGIIHHGFDRERRSGILSLTKKQTIKKKNPSGRFHDGSTFMIRVREFSTHFCVS